MPKPIARLIVIYDGYCPFCSRYVSHVRLRDVVQELRYVDARDGGLIVAEAVQKGFDLDDGMVVIIDDTYYYGADALQVLADLTSPVDAFNRLNATLLTSRTLSHIVYPLLRLGRNVLLYFLGRPKLALQQVRMLDGSGLPGDSYRAYGYLAPVLICIYSAVVIVHPDEFFPFFSWSLFSDTSNERIDFTIRLESVDDKPLASPRLYYDMRETFIHARQRDVLLQKTVYRLVVAIRAQDEETISRMRRLIEDRYMADIKSAEYDVARLTYNPITRLRTGEFKDISVLATYNKTPHD